MLMITAISVAGCGDKKDADSGDKGGDKASENDKGSAAKTTSPTGDMVVTKVSLPNMHWT